MLRLIGDIGGTNTRLALARDGAYGGLRSYLAADYPGIEECIDEYLAEQKGEGKPDEIALAIAGPVEADLVVMTNHPWKFRKSELKDRFGVARLEVLNDFTANAVSVPHLEPGDLEQIGGGAAVPHATIGILGPGTGLGVSGLMMGHDGEWVPIQGEGGHVSMAASTDRESAVIEVLRRRYGHVSAERVLSGDGLVNLYEALCTLDGVPSAAYKAAQISDPALGESDKQCREAVDIFCATLGMVAGDLALTLGARGGVYIAGGIVPRLGARFALSGFRRRFEDKGRFQTYMAPIPTFLITHRNPALVGLAHLP
ncbi:MAG TPA: glucokinase [Stellaceae bacterium]|nr:glucokinase [Stellaceae bacterium]